MLINHKFITPTTNFEARLKDIEEDYGSLGIGREHIWNARHLNQLRRMILYNN